MPSMVHIGVGNFHRAHQAWYTQRANDKVHGEDPWRITGVSLRSAAVRTALAPQRFHYTLATKSSEGTAYERIAVHDDILIGGEQTDAIIDAIACPDTALITVTVSEKGYCLGASNNSLDTDNPVIASELKSRRASSVIGFLAFGLDQRARTHATPLTVLSCDNLAANSHCLREALRDFGAAAGLAALNDYLHAKVRFPNTMVDRITPATSDALTDEVNAFHRSQEAPAEERLPVSTEPFSEWIIEDGFAGPRPAWHQVGASLVADVQPYELRKLRLLNGSHSLLAYAGLLAGHYYVHEAIADTALRAWVLGLMHEATETLDEHIQDQAPAYCDALIARFSNTSLHHSLEQIASDGSLKLPIRIISVMKERQATAKASPFAHKALDSWLRFVLTRLEQNAEINDPMAQKFREIGDAETPLPVKRSQLLALLEADPEHVSRWSVPPE